MIPLIHKHADMLNRNLTSYCLLVGFAAGMNFPNIVYIYIYIYKYRNVYS